MGKYYDVQQVEQSGKRVNPVYSTSGHTQPRFANQLVAVLDNGMRKIAVDVSKQSEFTYFYDSYFSGAWLTFNLWDYKPPEVLNDK